MSIATIILIILATPIRTFRKRGYGNDLGINIIFTMLFFMPGIIHAFYLTSKQNQIV
jgi:uncharacterized membrane protein YqaE (UPF0057 family)